MGTTDTTLASTIPGIIQGATGVYGAQNAAEAMTKADANAIGTQNTALGNIGNVWGTQQQLGQGADTALGSALGTNGQPADYSGFENMPGYQFAVQQGTQAIQRQAASMGNAYTPNTAIAVGQYVTGAANQNYNNYIQQLMGAAGLGTTANQGMQTGYQTNANNVSTLQQNQGYAQASGVTNASNAVNGLFSQNGAGTSLVNAGAGLLSKAFGGGTSGNGNNSSGNGNTPANWGTGTDPNTGQPYVDPNQIATDPSLTFDPNNVSMPDISGSLPDMGNIDPSTIDWSGYTGD